MHYAVKANANPKILRIIRESGLGADCVSGGEIQAAIQAGFPASKIVYAGVGKTDKEINLGLDYDIFCFNVESIPELEVINELAAAKNKIARVAFRINPDVGAHTHANITTGLAENKFGISMQDMDHIIDLALEMKNVKFVGLHFHIGSQILDMGDFVALCNRVNELQENYMPARLSWNTSTWEADWASTMHIQTASRFRTSPSTSLPITSTCACARNRHSILSWDAR